MDTITALLTRRSVRHYAPCQIPEAEVQLMLRSAMHAPSAHNEQPWHFVVLTERHLLDAVPAFHETAGPLRKASLGILVLGEPGLQVRPGRWMQDCAAATQNLLLAAHALGYGACWFSFYPQESRVLGMRALLTLPETIEPFALVGIGGRVDPLPEVDRFKPERVHYNRWEPARQAGGG
jgi:nitroreductase